MRTTWQLIALLASSVSAASLVAQGGGAWFGIPAPPPLSDPRKPVMKYDEVFAPLRAQFPRRAGRADELLDGAELKNAQRRIVDFSLESLAAGDTVWGRRAATPAFMHTIEWSVNAFTTAGLQRAAVESDPGAGSAVVPEAWGAAGG